MGSISFPRKSCLLWDNVEKYGGAREATNCHNMAHTCCMLDKQGYTRSRACTRPATYPRRSARARAHTQICDTFCLSTATKVLLTPLNVTLRIYVACLVALLRYFSLIYLSENHVRTIYFHAWKNSHGNPSRPEQIILPPFPDCCKHFSSMPFPVW